MTFFRIKKKEKKISVKCQKIVSWPEWILPPIRAIGRIFISTAAKEAPGGNVVPRIEGQKSERVDRKWQRNQMPGDNKQKADSMYPGQSPRYSIGKRIHVSALVFRSTDLTRANFPSNPSPLINSSAWKGELTAATILFPRKFLPSRYTRFESRSRTP